MKLRGVILALLAAALVASIVSPPGRIGIKTLLLLPELFPNAPARPLEWVTPAPRRTTVQLHYDGQASDADLYVPGTPGQHGAVIIFLGVAPAGRDDPRVVSLAGGLARVGLVTLIPESQDLIDSKVDPTEIDELVAGFQLLQNRPDVASDRIGLGGFCVGAALALDAAEDPRINQQVALVNSFTGFYDLGDYATSILTHSLQPFPAAPGTPRVEWDPVSNATAVLDDQLISLDPNGPEQARLRAARRQNDPGAVESSSLTPTGATIWSLLNARDPATVARLIAQLPPTAQAQIARLSPSTRLADLHAQVFIMHDRDDTTVPYVQSRLLAAQLRPNQSEVDEFQFFQHVDPTANVSPIVFVQDTARLGAHLFQIVEILEGVVGVKHF